MTKLRHYDNLDTARFITFSCFRRQPNLSNDSTKELFIAELNNARVKYRLRILGYVIMPEHVHLVLVPPEKSKLGLIIGALKSLIAKKYFVQNGKPDNVRGVFWERRCYDHNCRTTETVLEKINYCHNNPVKRKMAESPSEYRWSSYNWYQGVRDVPLEIDEF
jgi:putative transposase